ALPVDVRVAAVRVHHHGVRAGYGLSGPDGGIGGSRQAFDFLAGGHADAVEVAARSNRLRGDDPGGAVPRPGSAAGLNIAGDAVVNAGDGAADAGAVIDQMVVADVQPRRSDRGRVDGADAGGLTVGDDDELPAGHVQSRDARVIDGKVSTALFGEAGGAVDVAEGDRVGAAVDGRSGAVGGDVAAGDA